MSNNQGMRRHDVQVLMLSTALAAFGIGGLLLVTPPAQAQSAGPQGGTGGDGASGAGGAGGGPGMNGQPGTGPGGAAGGAAGGNATVGATGTAGGSGGNSGTGSDGGGGGPSITGTGTTATLNNPVGTTLTGSSGSAGTGSGGAGGYGVVVTTGGGSNAGTIDGGAPVAAQGKGDTRIGGAGGGGGGGGGALFLGSNITVTNTGGTISGGVNPTGVSVGAGGGDTPQKGGDGGRGGAGVEFVGSSTTLNAAGGSITGGTGGIGGGGGDTTTAGGTAGVGGAGGAGGIGVAFDQANGRLDNALGTITGGLGGLGYLGGDNISGAGGIGGAGGKGGTGGIGVSFGGSNSALVNSGMITGGAGASSQGGGRGNSPPFGVVSNAIGIGGVGGAGGNGGIGALFVGSGNTVMNAGTISGGNGAQGGLGGFSGPGNSGVRASSGPGGSGGSGVVASGTILSNIGTLTGGNGGAGGGAGGIGIVGSDLAIANTIGTIEGGFTNTAPATAPTFIPGVGLAPQPFTAGPRNYAIQLTGGTNTVGTGGTITGGMAVLSGASLQPALNGSTPGTTLAVTGPVAFAAGSFYTVRITPTANDSVTATGAATLTGATVNVLAGQGTYATGTRTILTATGSLGGTTFAGVTANLAFMMPTLSYDADDVFLTITGNAANGSVDYRTAASTQNQLAVASGLTVAGRVNGGTGPILTALNQLTVPQAQAAFDSLSGEGITAAQNAAHRQVSEFTSSIFDQTTFYGGAGTANSITLTAPQPGAGFFALAPSGTGIQGAPIHELADLPSRAPPPPVLAPARTWRAWATGFGGADDIHGQPGIGSATQRDTIYGGTLGVDYQLLPNYLAGVAIGGSDGTFDVAGRATSGSTTGGHIAFYDLATFGAFYGASSNSFSYFTNRTTRNIAGFGGLAGETDRGDFDSHEFRTRLEFGRHFGGADLARFGFGGVVTPFIALELADLRSNGFAERNLAGPTVLGLNVQGQSSASVPSFVGLRYQGVAALGNGMVLTPSLQVAYVHEFAPQRTQIGGLIDLPGSTFLVDGARPARNAVQTKAGAEMAIGPHSTIFATFDGEFSGQAQFYGGKGGVRYVW